MTMDLQPHEAKLIDLIRSLPAHAVQEVEDFAAFKASRETPWNGVDTQSLARHMERMANDPQMLAEVQAIERDFAPALGDGLEKL